MSFEAGRVEATLTLDRSPFTRSLEQARRAVARFASRSYKATLGVEDNTRAPLAAANRRLEDFDGEKAEARATVDVDFNRIRRAIRSVGSLEKEMGKLASTIRAVGTIMRAAAIPLFVASIGALPTVISAVAVQAGRLAIALSQGVAGGAAVVGTAFGGMVAGLRIFQGLATNVVMHALEVNEALNQMIGREGSFAAVLQNVAPYARDHIRAIHQFGEAYDTASFGLRRLRDDLSIPILKSFSDILLTVNSHLNEIQPIAMRAVTGVSNIARSFVYAIAVGERWENVTRVLNFVATSAIRGAKAAKNLGLGLLAAIQPVLGPADRLQQRFVGLTRQFRVWAESGRGQNQIADFIENAWNRAKQLYRIVLNLGRGFGNLFSIIAPGTNGMMRNLEDLSASFARVGAKGTESRRKIEQFVANTRPILKALGNLVGTITREFFKLAGGVARTEEGKRHVNVLAGAINGLARAIPPVRRLLHQTFQNIGPIIGPLVRQIARFGSELAEAGGVARRVLGVMTGLLRQFNRLPEPVKNAVASLVALRIVSRLLGVTILVKLANSLRKAAIELLGFGKKAKGVQAANAVMRGSFLRLATTIVTRFGPGGAVYVFGKLAKHVLLNSKAMERILEGFAARLRNTGAFGLIKFFQNLPNALKNAVAQGAKNIPIFGPIIQQAVTDGRDVAKQWSKNGQQSGQNAREGFKRGFGTGSGWWSSLGKDAASGVLKGFQSAKLGVSIAGTMKNVYERARDAIEAHSHSRLFERGVGAEAGEGVIVGFENAMRRGKGRMARALGGGFAEMEASWRPLLRKIQAGQEFDIGGDLGKSDTPRAIWNALRASGWLVRGNTIFHPETPRSTLRAASDSRSREQRTGSLGAQQRSQGGISKEEMRAVMREHRTESRRSQGGSSGLAQEIATAVITVLNSKAYASHLDRSMGGYFNHRNAMGADPR